MGAVAEQLEALQSILGRDMVKQVLDDFVWDSVQRHGSPCGWMTVLRGGSKEAAVGVGRSRARTRQLELCVPSNVLRHSAVCALYRVWLV